MYWREPPGDRVWVRAIDSPVSPSSASIEASNRYVALEAELTARMLFIRNEDKPGFIGRLGTLLGEAGINIANFNLGPSRPGATAACPVAVDSVVMPPVLDQVRVLQGVVDVALLQFENGG